MTTYLKITEIFPINSVGIVTSRDDFELIWTRIRLKEGYSYIHRIITLPDEIIQQTYQLKNKTNWSTSEAREKIRQEDNWEEYLIKSYYYPFDTRWIYFHDAVIERARKEIMNHMLTDKYRTNSKHTIRARTIQHMFINKYCC